MRQPRDTENLSCEPTLANTGIHRASVCAIQVQNVSNVERDEAWRRIRAAATAHGVEMHEAGWRELFSKHDGTPSKG